MDRYVVIHVHTTCDEHGVYVTKDSAEVIEIGWILLHAKTLEEVSVLSIKWFHFALVNNSFMHADSQRERPSQAYQHPNNASLQ